MKIIAAFILIALLSGCASTNNAPVTPAYAGNVSTFEANATYSSVDLDKAFLALQNAYIASGFKITELDERQSRIVAAMSYSKGLVKSYAQLYQVKGGVVVRLSTKIPQGHTQYSEINAQLLSSLEGLL